MLLQQAVSVFRASGWIFERDPCSTHPRCLCPSCYTHPEGSRRALPGRRWLVVGLAQTCGYAAFRPFYRAFVSVGVWYRYLLGRQYGVFVLAMELGRRGGS